MKHNQFAIIIALSTTFIFQTKSNEPILPEVTTRAYAHAVLNVVEHSTSHPRIISDHEWEELQLDVLLEKLDRTSTSFGRWGLEKLLQPIANKQELERRQKIVSLLVSDQKLFTQLQSILKKIAENEEALLDYFKDNLKLHSNVSTFYFDVPVIGSHLNNNVFALEGNVILQGLDSFRSLIANLCLNGINNAFREWVLSDKEQLDFAGEIKRQFMGPIMQHSFNHDKADELYQNGKIPSYKEYVRASLFGSLGDRYTVLHSGYKNNLDITLPFIGQLKDKHFAQFPKPVALVLAAAPTVMYDILWFNALNKAGRRIYFLYSILNQLQNQLTCISKLFNAVQELEIILKENSLFSEFASELERYKPTFLRYLHKNTFNSKKSLLYSRGNVLKVHKLLAEERIVTIPILQIVSYIDAFCSIAKLYTESKQFSFAQFVDSNTPIMTYKKALLSIVASNIVTNDIPFDYDTSSKMIITGPNGGGKSTYLKTIGQLAVLAQSWTIVPAQEGKQCLFSGIKTGLDTREDLGNGLSTFMAEKKRMQELQMFIDVCDEHNYGLVLIDEPYRGTVDEESARRIFDFGKAVARQEYCIVGLATHVRKPITLERETDGLFVNYHVEIISNVNGTFKRTFKVIPGIARWWFDNPELRGQFVDWIGQKMEYN